VDSFDIDISAPIDPSGFSSDLLGGPNVGGHVGPHWYIQYGMDLAGAEGTPVYAAFDAHITKFHPDPLAAADSKVYGAQIFMRAPNDGMGGFYTHLGNVPEGLGVGSQVARGDLLGTVLAHGGIPPHLHLALVEIIGGLPGGEYRGVANLYQFFLDLQVAEPGAVLPVTFLQDGTPPAPRWP
jgi:murein DD-endopeptidase MepM/ murein hydrolase activator NlpD